MKTPTISYCLALTLPLWAAVPGGSTTALASADLRVPEVAFVMLAPSTVVDQALLEFRLRDAGSELVADLKIDGEWTATDGDIVDVIAADSPIAAVTSQFQPPAEHEHRMRFKSHGSPTWGPWSAWTTSRIAHQTATPAAGQQHTDELEASARPAGSGSAGIAVHGYIKIKKLNSGG